MLRIAVIAFIIFPFLIRAQNQKEAISSDSTIVKDYVINTNHTGTKATILSAALPGLGQIYNNAHKPPNRKSRLWWKLPLIYGGIGTGIYFFSKNQTQYIYYRNQRRDLYNSNQLYSTKGYSDSQLKSISDQYEKWRDLSVIGTLAVYLLNIIDANVEGTLLHFDCGDDLSLKIEPTVINYARTTYTGASIKLRF